MVRRAHHERLKRMGPMIAALVPAKRLSQAKGRLAAVLSDEERRRLALAMLADVLAPLLAVPRIQTTAVVSSDPQVLALARSLGAEAIVEPPPARDVNAALTFAARALARWGIEALLVVPMDVPLLAAADVEAILDALPFGRGVVLCPSRAGGTSALALRPPDAVPFRFGPESFAAHCYEAALRGLSPTVLRIESLMLDIDSPADLANLLASPCPELAERAHDTRSHRALRDMGIPERLGLPSSEAKGLPPPARAARDRL
ncbi:MAG: 2-phospho-L-lactate guanylyltransferase [Chloroflexota bacterium]|nr:2-phospho-L-lactate guanylyltransferase [Chloroflexota bacterium]